MRNKFSPRRWRGLFWLALVSVVVLSLAPLTGSQLFSWEDKLKHAIAYGGLFFLSIEGFGRKAPYYAQAALLIMVGVIVEFLQSLTGYRLLDVWDMLANATGVLAVWLGAVLWRCNGNRLYRQ